LSLDAFENTSFCPKTYDWLLSTDFLGMRPLKVFYFILFIFFSVILVQKQNKQLSEISLDRAESFLTVCRRSVNKIVDKPKIIYIKELVLKSNKLADFIKENSHLFWSIPESQKMNISTESLVENILNYGDEESIIKLFELVGSEKVANIFFHQINSNRTNYYPQVKNFFTLYFNRHVQKNSNTTTD